MKLMFCAQCGSRVYLDEPHTRKGDQYWHADCPSEKVRTNWARACFIAFLIIAGVLVALRALGQDYGAHGEGHGFYQDWANQSGGDCCNEGDCHEAYYWRRSPDPLNPFEVRINGEWKKVQPWMLTKNGKSNGAAHVCFYIGDDGAVYVRCFRPGVET